ncbi:nitrile hydratase accessory protein [Oceanibium sediminis]|uniref:nitrile hydratase accessory protein n=1 Tax=Oceanibium sediminis TaxID=2026339 RepID=UPI000DD4BB6A|nr:nitrile hydratase accessory protein [Oceanibium sediminis]
MPSNPTSTPPDTPPFDAPWQAQAVALTVALIDAGVFTWADWGQAFGRRRAPGHARDDGADYYDHWLETLEEVLAARALALADAVRETASAWRRAAAATPHGTPIRLENDPHR